MGIFKWTLLKVHGYYGDFVKGMKALQNLPRTQSELLWKITTIRKEALWLPGKNVCWKKENTISRHMISVEKDIGIKILNLIHE